MTKTTTAELMAQRVDRDVRQMLGELMMQTIVLRAALDMAQQSQEPEPQSTEQNVRTNGASHQKGF